MYCQEQEESGDQVHNTVQWVQYILQYSGYSTFYSTVGTAHDKVQCVQYILCTVSTAHGKVQSVQPNLSTVGTAHNTVQCAQ